MEDIKKQLLSQFEIQYGEFKEAEDFLKNYSEEKAKDFENAIKSLINSNISDNLEESINLVRDYKTIPKMLALDLDVHKERLLSAFQIIENVLEISQEKLEKIQEIKNFKNKTIFIRDKGVNKVLNQPYYDSIIASTKDPAYIKVVIDTYKNMYNESQNKK
jgi:DNA integrity scanning protein DisA with diadenylate cyclase activity